MSLTERFVEVKGWSTARKTALLAGGVVLPGHLLGWAVGAVILGPLELVQSGWFHAVTAMFVAVGLSAFLISWGADRRGSDGRWPFFVLTVPYGLVQILFIYAFGAQSTAVMTWAPMAVLVFLVWFDDWVTWFLFGQGLVVMTFAFLPPAIGWEFAPALVDLDLRAQDSGRYGAWIAAGVLLYFAVAFVCVALVLAAARLDRMRLDETLTELGKATELISRYIPADVAKDILAGSLSESQPPERRRITVFFSDVVDFSDLVDALEPEELAQVLNEYFSQMTAIAHRHGGTIDELQGDALLIFFGAPHFTDDRRHALDAVSMAIDMRAAIDSLNRSWNAAGITEVIRVRMGINTGVVTVGSFGSPERMKYAALGRHVNIAARLQSACPPDSCLISHSTWALVRHEVTTRPAGELQLKGLAKPVLAYEILENTSTEPIRPGS